MGGGDKADEYFNEQLSHLISYTIHLLSQFNIIFYYLLQTSSCILICCFRIITSRSEFDKKFIFTYKIIKLNKWRYGINVAVGKIWEKFKY